MFIICLYLVGNSVEINVNRQQVIVSIIVFVAAEIGLFKGKILCLLFVCTSFNFLLEIL